LERAVILREQRRGDESQQNKIADQV
jgi:hypothetical protein